MHGNIIISPKPRISSALIILITQDFILSAEEIEILESIVEKEGVGFSWRCSLL